MQHQGQFYIIDYPRYLSALHCIVYINIIVTPLPGQGLEQPGKELSLKVQKDVPMKRPAPLPSMLYSSYLLNFTR
jgi:hypothetical protein